MSKGNGSTTTGKGKRGKTPGQDTERVVKLELLCELTPKEHEEKSDRLAQLDLAINATQEEAKAKAASYRESIKLLKEERMAQGQLPWGSVAELPEKPENDITEDPPRPAA